MVGADPAVDPAADPLGLEAGLDELQAATVSKLARTSAGTLHSVRLML
jgi:hypothetical protein